MPIRAGQFNIGSAQINFTGNNLEPFVRCILDFLQERAFAEQDSIGAGAFYFRPTPLVALACGSRSKSKTR